MMIDVTNIIEAVKSAPMDEKAGIKVVPITGDDLISVFAAEVAPGTELKPHYHSVGIEIYQVYKGSGVMKIGSVNKGAVIWEESLDVSTGDSFSILEGKVHQIINNSDEPLIMLFTCSKSHLGDDRFFV